MDRLVQTLLPVLVVLAHAVALEHIPDGLWEATDPFAENEKRLPGADNPLEVYATLPVAQLREMIAWILRERPEASDRCVAGQTGANHRAVAGVRKQLEAGGEILHLPNRTGLDGKKYPAAALDNLSSQG